MAVAFALIAVAIGSALIDGYSRPATSGAPSSTQIPEPRASPSPEPPFVLNTVPADGFPLGWWRITAADRSFTLVGPGPAELEPNRRFWEMDVHGSLDPRCFMYLFEAGPVTHPATAMKARLLSWAKRFIAFDEPVPVRSGDAVGWRTHITTRKGQPYGELEVVYVDGWGFDIGYQQVNFTAETARLGTRFLDSFEAPAPRVGNRS